MGLCIGWHPSINFGLASCELCWSSFSDAVEDNPGSLLQPSHMKSRLLWAWVVLLMTGLSPDTYCIIFISVVSLPSFQSLWRLLLPQGSVGCKGSLWLGVEAASFYVALACVLDGAACTTIASRELAVELILGDAPTTWMWPSQGGRS